MQKTKADIDRLEVIPVQKFRVCFEIEVTASGETRDEAIENAKKAPVRLIAAAPDYERGAQEVIEHIFKCQTCDGTGQAPDVKDACRDCGGYGETLGLGAIEGALTLRAAIAKATKEVI